MKIVFIDDKVKQKGKISEKVYGCSYSIYPTPDLFMLYNASVLKKAGHDVSIFRLENINDQNKIPPASIYLINSVILSYERDIFIAALLKRKKVYFFGPYSTLYPEKYLKYRNHFVLRGETEHYIVNAILNPLKTCGVSYIRNGKIIHNKTAGIIENLDSIPFPLRQIDDQKYYNPKLGHLKFTNILSSRGCANRCYFCVPNSMSWARELEWKKYKTGKPPVKIRSAENIILELIQLKNEGYKELSFIDDQFIVGKERILKILNALEKFKMKYGILARADRLLDKEIVEKLASSGCRYVDIGAESFNQEVLDDIKKDIKVSTIYKAVRLLAKYNVEPKLNIMFGTSPKETRPIIEDTVKKTLNLPSNYCMFSIATPFPGTEFRKVAEKNEWIVKDKNTNPASIAQISYPHLSSQKLESINRKANLKFYLRYKIIKRQFISIKSPKDVIILFKLVLNQIKNFI